MPTPSRALGLAAAFHVALFASAGASEGGGGVPPAAPRASEAIERLEVYPTSPRLTGPDSVQHLVVTGYTREGRTRDLTRQAQFESARPDIAQVSPAGVVGPVADGQAELVVRAAGLAARLTATVTDAQVRRLISFRNEVLPVLTKAGCNSGGCHGKASGQNGFKLSVFGFDTRFDYDALVKEGRGRRIFPAAPEHSLMLRKPTGQVPHGGGIRFTQESAAYRTLEQWIAQGAPPGGDDDPRVLALEVWPTERELLLDDDQQLVVTAIYSDGARRDVTAQAEFASNVEPVATVDEAGLMRSGQVPGEAAIMVRFMGEVAVSRVIRPRGDLPDYEQPPVHNLIDGLVWAKLRKLGIVPSGLCTDSEFLRRSCIDTIGTLPTAEEAATFLNDEDPAKRARLVDRLLERPQFADYWALRWGDVLRVDTAALGRKGAYVFHEWLRDSIAAGMPYDQMVRAILTARGDTTVSGPANLYRAVKGAEELSSTVSQVFLGVRIECAQCHHHPYERWGQDDFYAMAAFFAQLGRKNGPRGQEVILVGASGEAKHPGTGAVVAPRPLGAGPLDLTGYDDRRAALADWVTAPDNPYLARMVANRLWAHFLGRGLVEPVDDMRTTNPASNEPLLAGLARYTVEQRFDLRALVRLILNSRVYQLSSDTNDTNALDTQNFSHALVKGIPAEVLLDAIAQATGMPEKFEGWPSGTRAIELWDNRFPNYFLEIFGKPVRASVCECERSAEPSMTQALHLLNSPGIERKVSSPRGRVRQLLAEGGPDTELVRQLYLATLSRFPTGEEAAALGAAIQSRGDRRRATEDLLWALMNSPEFVFNR